MILCINFQYQPIAFVGSYHHDHDEGSNLPMRPKAMGTMTFNSLFSHQFNPILLHFNPLPTGHTAGLTGFIHRDHQSPSLTQGEAQGGESSTS